MTSRPHFLRIAPFHLSEEKARKLVDAELAKMGVRRGSISTDQTVTISNDIEKFETTYRKLITATRKDACVQPFQRERDFKNSVFGGRRSDMGVENWGMTLKSEWAGYATEMPGPAWMQSPSWILTHDIFFFREDCCSHSDKHGMVASLRAFRSYLGTCISITEAFINRYIALAKHDSFSSTEFTELQTERTLERKFELWLEVFTKAGSKGSSFFKSRQWSDFQKIRDYRNRVVHAVDPIAAYGIYDVQQHLNYVREGVGGLFLRMREARAEPTLGFIERLRTAPLVYLRRADGKGVVKETV
jgi:hypothetical protein